MKMVYMIDSEETIELIMKMVSVVSIRAPLNYSFVLVVRLPLEGAMSYN